jgi:hypothetical protein
MPVSTNTTVTGFGSEGLLQVSCSGKVIPFALDPGTFVRDFNASYAFYNLTDDSLQCFFGNCDVLIFVIWFCFALSFSTMPKKKLKSTAVPGELSERTPT